MPAAAFGIVVVSRRSGQLLRVGAGVLWLRLVNT